MKIILFANTDWYLYNFRLSLAKHLTETKNEVVLISPPGDFALKILERGFDWRPIHLSRKGLNVFKEIRSIYQLIKVFSREKPDIVHNFTTKCIVYGTIAARNAKTGKIINSVTGLGYIFAAQNLFTFVLKIFLRVIYRFLLKNTTVIFQNKADRDFLIRQKMVQSKNSILIPSSGVDVSKFVPKPERIEPGLVILAGRMLWDKGVKEFVQAARLLKDHSPKIRFVLVGPIDDGNPTSIPEQEIFNWIEEGLIEWWGWQEDMVSIYQQAEIVCLPSYHEGLSKSLIEAASCGCPIIASDIPGCQEVVNHNVNGYLINKGDAQALADAIVKILHDPKKSKEMGLESRSIAIKNFNLEKVVRETLEAYNILHYH